MAEGAPRDLVLHSVIRGHHIYKRIWTPVVGEELLLQRDLTNIYDIFAVGIMKDGMIVGHVPIELSFGVCTFIQRGGDVSCEVTGSRTLGKGLEVPCIYKCKAKGNTQI